VEEVQGPKSEVQSPVVDVEEVAPQPSPGAPPSPAPASEGQTEEKV
jgi:hypothetical protein